jgi:hypothetical protein
VNSWVRERHGPRQIFSDGSEGTYLDWNVLVTIGRFGHGHGLEQTGYDLFVVGRDGGIYSTFWDANGGWFGHWFRV